MLATCNEIGVKEVYRVGGAQAVAALAYGVEGIPRVDKIVGPGICLLHSPSSTYSVTSTSTASRVQAK